MCKLIFILNCVILVTSNPLQPLQTCPLTVHLNNYAQQDRQPTVPLNNFSPYQQQFIVQNQLTPSYQTIPYLCSGQSNPSFSSFANPIISVYDRNGIEIKRYIVNLTGTLPNVNNYITVPSELINQNNVNKKERKNSTWKNIDKLMETSNSEQLKVTNQKSSKISGSGNNTNKNKVTINKGDKTKCKKNAKREDCETNSKRKSSENGYRKLQSEKVDNAEKQDRRRKKNSKLKTVDEINDKSKELTNIRKNNSDNNPKKIETENKKADRKNKAKPKKRKVKNDIQEEVNFNVKPKECHKNTADVEVCFDINEDCTNLENRRTRNNKYDYRTNNQQPFPKEFSDYFTSSMNNAIYNQQLNPNFYNSIANFPFNFDYIYQILQQTNAKPIASGKRRKNRRKKQKSNKENKKANDNKNQDTLNANNSNDCEKVVELTPQYMETEQTTELVNAKETSINEAHGTDKVEDKIRKDKANHTPKSLPDKNEPITYTTDNSHEDTVQNIAEKQGDYVPFINENCIPDDYYPDFTSDNNYLSKEEFEIDNFHDRYYYASDKEMSREKRKYERANRKHSKHFNNNEAKTGEGNKKGKKDDSKELNFRVPPALEFPDFKTEMIDKERYLDYENDYSNTKALKNVKTYSDIEEINLDFNKNRDNGVETVFAHSKVIKYGGPPEETASVIKMAETNKREQKKLSSNGGLTTVVLAKSLDYNDY